METLNEQKEVKNENTIDKEREEKQQNDEVKEELLKAEKEKNIYEDIKTKIEDYKLQEEREYDRIKKDYTDKMRNINSTNKEYDKNFMLTMVTGGMNLVPFMCKDIFDVVKTQVDEFKQMERLERQIKNNDAKINHDFIKEIVINKNVSDRFKRETKSPISKDKEKEKESEQDNKAIQIEKMTIINNFNAKFGKNLNIDFENMKPQQFLILIETVLNEYENKKTNDEKQDKQKLTEDEEKKIEELKNKAKNIENKISEFDKNINEDLDNLDDKSNKLTPKQNKKVNDEVLKQMNEITENVKRHKR